MRIAPVGIATPPQDIAAFVARVAEACRVTHATREAIAAAAAVAMVISQGVAGCAFDDAIAPALEAATMGATLGAAVGERDMAGRIVAALDAARGGEEAILAVTGNSVASRASIPAAFGILRLAGGDPWRAAVIAANFGDDTDTIGSIACAMAGACGGLAAFPADKVARVMAVNGLDLAPLASGLLELRASAAPRPRGPAHDRRLIQLSGVIVDLVYRVDKVPDPGTEAIVQGFALTPGGGLNAMVAARRMGLRVDYGGTLGTGPFADLVARALAAEGIGVIRPRLPGLDQGCCTVLVDAQGERSFIAAAGADGVVSDADLAAIHPQAEDAVLLSGYALSYPEAAMR